MTHRIAIAVILSLASACAVTGEESDPFLEEIEASCSSQPEPGKRGELEVVRLSKDGRDVTYKSLTREERELLDDTLDFIEDDGHSGDTGCDFSPSSWTCEGGGYLCTCVHGSSGPSCTCDTTTC